MDDIRYKIRGAGCYKFCIVNFGFNTGCRIYNTEVPYFPLLKSFSPVFFVLIISVLLFSNSYAYGASSVGPVLNISSGLLHQNGRNAPIISNKERHIAFFKDSGQYGYAMFLFEQGNYIVAVREFGRLIEFFPSSPLIEDAQFNMGMAYLKAKRYADALKQFRLYLQNFPQGRHLYEVMDKREVAFRALQDIEKQEMATLKEESNSPQFKNKLSNKEPFIQKKGGFDEGIEVKMPPIPVKPPPQISKSKEEPLSKTRDQETTSLSKKIIKKPHNKIISEKAPVKKTFFAVQVHVFFGKNYDEIDREIKGLKKQGYDVLILRVFHNRGDRFYPFIKPRASEGVYFKTSFAPVVSDILTPVLKIAKKYDLKVFAWMTTRNAVYGLKGRGDLRCKAFDFESNSLSECKGLDLFNDEVVRYLEGLYRDLAKYPIDGILFQDDLILRHNEGFGAAASSKFVKAYKESFNPELFYGDIEELKNSKYSVEYTKKFWKWASWKNKYILSVASRLMDVARDENPELKFAINMMYEAAYMPSQALAWLSQSLKAAKEVGFDFYSIMAYHRQIEDELGIDFKGSLKVISDMIKYASQEIGDTRKLLIKLQLVDWNSLDRVSANELEDILKILSNKDVNIAFSPYERFFLLDKVTMFRTQ